MEYIIAIPTYKRSKTIEQETLGMLSRNNLKGKAVLFVANQEEKIEYENNVERSFYKEIIVGRLGLKEQRNFICDYYKEGEYIIMFDDDFKDIEELYLNVKGQPKTQPIKYLDLFINKAIKEMEKTGFYLFGIYPVRNGFFMSEKTTYDLRSINGGFFGFRNTRKIRSTIQEKEDYERTIMFYKEYGGVIRYSNLTMNVGYLTNKGGIQEFNLDRVETNMKSALYLYEKYPEYCDIKLTKKSGIPEVKLKDKRKPEEDKNQISLF